MKIRKNHRGKRYRYNVNRKTLNKTRSSTGKIKDPAFKKLWEDSKRPGTNFKEMGLCVDPNKSVPIPNFRKDRLKITKLVNGFEEEEITEDDIKKAEEPKRGHVVAEMEEMAKQKAESKFRLPKGVVSHISYFMDKYKFNYKAMVTDRRNHDQWTWKQFRMKIKQFMNIKEQFNVYLEKRNLPLDKELDWEEYNSDSEWQ
ncbi:nucleolar protein 16-like [Musca vetustissima]|uniref:nucleolar protein 16-like n=1 Tax=Musca vetustissima TaxID=27455 RepID=UPI002AB76014|nr:nucleolar protein 16-like [Musca vetustissima]